MLKKNECEGCTTLALFYSKEKIMRTENREEKVIRKYKVYIAKDGKEFENENDCRDYELSDSQVRLEKLDKYIDKTIEDMIPINYSAEFSEFNTYTWIKVNDYNEYKYVNQILDELLDEPKGFPYFYCIETENDFEGYPSDYITTLEQSKKITKNFWKNLGYNVRFERRNNA